MRVSFADCIGFMKIPPSFPINLSRCDAFLRWFSTSLAIFVGAVFLSSCHSEKQAALDLISDRGLTANGEALFEALDAGDQELAGALIVLLSEPDYEDSMGRTPLMIASGGSGEGLLSQLIEKGADVEATDSTGRTALGYAVDANCHESIVMLLRKGANPSVNVDTGGSLVASALRQDRLAAAGLLLDAGADLGSKGASGESLARVAVEEGHRAILGKLVELGLDLKEQGSGEGGLLHLALDCEDDGMLAFLLENGLDPNEKNARGESLVHAIVGKAKLHLLPLLKEYGVSFDSVDPQGWTLVHLAILAHDYELLNLLLDYGADANQLSKGIGNSMPPLSLAIENRLFSMARLLLRYGAEPGDEMYQAVKRGGQDGQYLVKLLLESGASPSPSRVPALDSPIGLAVRSDEYEIAKLLLDAGASHESRDLCGQKPLHIAVARGNAKMAGLLLDMGADPNEPFHPKISDSFLELVKTDGIGKWALKKSKELYPIMLASDSGNLDVALQLIAHGASTKKSTKVGYNRMWPLTFATRRSDTRMMQVMLGRKPGRSKLWIKVDLSEQRAYVYDGSEQVYKTRVSTGKAGYRTRQGKFVITNKYRSWNSTIYGSSMPYFQRLSASDFGFHVGHVPSYPASHGCIRMPHSAAKKLFGMTKVGDYVEIVP